MTAPIALFVYNRPDMMHRTLDALAANPLASESELFIFSDGPRKPQDEAKIAEIRSTVPTVRGFATVMLVAAPTNQGLSRSIIGGVTRLTREFGRCIVLEDDIVTAPHFLTFMNAALDKYADNPRVAAISGYTPEFDVTPSAAFFQRDAECWGWATWARAWTLFNPDGPALLAQLKQRRLLDFFDHGGTSDYLEMLRQQIAGRVDSWAVRWRASVVLAGMLSLYPPRSLTRNIGFDDSGTHTQSGQADMWNVRLASEAVALDNVTVGHSDAAYEAFQRFNRRYQPSGVARLRRNARRLLRRLTG